VGSLTQSQIKNGLKDRNSLVQFIDTVLRYRTAPVAYEDPTQELRIPPYLSTKISGWWFLCSYPGRIPFQIHFAEIKELTFYTCKDIVVSFLRSHPANYLFIFTEDYCYIVFFAVERSLEREQNTLRLRPKYYYRFSLVDCRNPAYNDLLVLDRIRLERSTEDSVAIYDRVITPLKLAGPSNDTPEWFMPWYYRMGYSEETYDRLRESGLI